MGTILWVSFSLIWLSTLATWLIVSACRRYIRNIRSARTPDYLLIWCLEEELGLPHTVEFPGRRGMLVYPETEADVPEVPYARIGFTSREVVTALESAFGHRRLIGTTYHSVAIDPDRVFGRGQRASWAERPPVPRPETGGEGERPYRGSADYAAIMGLVSPPGRDTTITR